MDLAHTLGTPFTTFSDGTSRLDVFLGEPACLVMSLRGAHYSESLANQCRTTGYAALKRRFPAREMYTFVHDFGEVKSYDSEGRRILIQWGREVARGGCSVLCIPPDMPTLLRVAVSTGTAVVAALGFQISVTTDPATNVLTKLGFAPVRGAA